MLKKPPAEVELVCSVVAIMLHNDIASWRDIQKAIRDRKFIASMMQLDTLWLNLKQNLNESEAVPLRFRLLHVNKICIAQRERLVRQASEFDSRCKCICTVC